ncbi:hypothetical protein ACFLT1_03790 [Bacteroidota bacterium]
MKRFILLSVSLFCLTIGYQSFGQGNYNNFKVSVYTRAYEVQMMEDSHWLDSTWEVISSQLDVDKIYLETHRDLLIVNEKTLNDAIKFFKKKGLEIAGGITYTINEGNLFETFCYTNPEHRQKAKEIIEFTAAHFDEVILDDFFFTSCKCELCMDAKGDRSWSEYRLELMTEATKQLIMEPARKVNPNVKVIIKYPNWYDHFQELGFNLETQPPLFDELYTGTETRDAVMSNQHLQPYLGYLIFRYFNNLKPGKNGGGWVDTGGMIHYDRYAEQLWLTIFAKAPEMTLFDYRQMLYPLRDGWIASWKNETTSFSYASFLPLTRDNTIAKTASHALQIVDKVAGHLGNPVGVKSYKPYHSSGEDFLQNYLGMIGIPLDLVPEFPMEDPMILLTEQASYDPEIVHKIEARLRSGKDVIITSGLLKALEDRGIRNIVNLKVSDRKAEVRDFMSRRSLVEGKTAMLIPQIQYFTNDSWELISGMDDGLGWPLLHMARVADATLYVLTIPENFANLYDLPEPVLNQVRQTFTSHLGISLVGPSRTAFFLYDNNTCVLESFNDTAVKVRIQLSEKPDAVKELTSSESLELLVLPEMKFRNRVFRPEQYEVSLTLAPHSFKVLKFEE